MRRMSCKSCNKAIGYIKPTGEYVHGFPKVESILTHAEWKDVLTFPKAKREQDRYTKRLICEYCGNITD